MGIQEIKFYEKYLWLPALVGRGEKASFSCIKEMVSRKLQGGKGKLLSRVGTEVLIKLVVQAIPTYAMECFKLPLGLCHDIEAMIKKFFLFVPRQRDTCYHFVYPSFLGIQLLYIYDLCIDKCNGIVLSCSLLTF